MDVVVYIIVVIIFVAIFTIFNMVFNRKLFASLVSSMLIAYIALYIGMVYKSNGLYSDVLVADIATMGVVIVLLCYVFTRVIVDKRDNKKNQDSGGFTDIQKAIPA